MLTATFHLRRSRSRCPTYSTKAVSSHDALFELSFPALTPDGSCVRRCPQVTISTISSGRRARLRRRITGVLVKADVSKPLASRVADFIVSRGDRKTFTAEDFEAALKDLEPADRDSLLSRVAASRVAEPTSKSATKSPSKRYRIVVDPLTPAERGEALVRYKKLDVRLRRTGYLKDNLDVFLDYERDLTLLSSWLLMHGRDMDVVTRKERSYEIWGDEKRLEDSKHSRGLTELLFDKLCLEGPRELRYRSTVSADYVYWLAPVPGCVLVSENKDLYVDIKNMIAASSPAAALVCGEHIRGCVLGSGFSAASAGFGKFLSEIGVAPAEVLYVGDVDVDGVAIAQAVEDAGHGRAFYALYDLMLRRHAERRAADRPLNIYIEKQRRAYDKARFLSGLGPEAAREADFVLSRKIRVPQEILSASILAGEGR